MWRLPSAGKIPRIGFLISQFKGTALRNNSIIISIQIVHFRRESQLNKCSQTFRNLASLVLLLFPMLEFCHSIYCFPFPKLGFILFSFSFGMGFLQQHRGKIVSSLPPQLRLLLHLRTCLCLVWVSE